MIKANRVPWIKCLLSSKGKWTTIISDLIKPLSLEHFLQTNLSDDDIACIPILFYRQIIKSWNELKQKTNNPKHYIEEVLWDNKYFLTQGQIKNKKKKKHTMFCPKWYKAGVIRLGELLNGNGKIMEFKTLTVKFSINCNILFYYKVIKAIPKEWLTEIKQFVHQISFL